jgi:Nif-specific regulatory protein
MTIEQGTAGSAILARLVELAAAGSGPGEFLDRALAAVVRNVPGVKAAAIVQGIKGAWRELAVAGDALRSGSGPPRELLPEALDQESIVSSGGWSAVPLAPESRSGTLLVLQGSPPLSDRDLTSLAGVLGLCHRLVSQGADERHRARRLAAMLEMTVQWNQSRRTDELLQTMAETSTRLLDAERATIFLRDRTGTRLIGRPALGVEGGELNIAANTGVVGQVVQSGQPRRIDEDIAGEQAEIDRAIDTRLGFRTRSLLCVPMFGSDGRIIGAFELLNKREGSFTDGDVTALAELAGHAAVAIENTLHVEGLNSSRRTVADEAAGKVRLIGDSPAMQALKKTVERVAGTDLAVLILGENGTGKEVVAQLIHYLGPRRDHVIVAVNCAAITETLLESELFGHERGAFTDAHETRQGKFELASGGTLFLDEIGDMSPGGQAKLLRVLEEKVVVRVGGSRPIPVDTRVIAATNQDLARLVRDRKFREDLFFRLNVVTLELPPLRDRGEDILALANHFLADFSARARRNVPQLTAAARKRLLGHGWPGNVRELRNLMERLAYLSPEDRIDAADLSFVTAPGGEEGAISMDQPLAEATRQFQADYIERHIRRARGNITDAAERLGLHRSNLYRKMKQLGMEPGEPDE